MHTLYAGIEFGGTKTICAVGTADGELFEHTTIPTTTPDSTLVAVYDFLASQHSITAIGVGAFGPLNLDTSSPRYGAIYNTPKPGWSGVELKRLLEEHSGLPVAIEHDVNCAALGEHYFGAAKDVRNFVYLTIGTGIGGAMVLDGRPAHGVRNLEMGHMRLPHEPFPETFKGACVFHGDCLEGIASGHAMAVRYGKKAEEITDDTAWQNEADYIAAALNNLMMTVGPERIVLGGGLINHAGLIGSVRAKVEHLINGYLEFPGLESYLVPSSGDMNGVLGAIKLASLQTAEVATNKL